MNIFSKARDAMSNAAGHGLAVLEVKSLPQVDFKQPVLPVDVVLGGATEDVTVDQIRVEVIRAVRTTVVNHSALAWDSAPPAGGLGQITSDATGRYSFILSYAVCSETAKGNWLVRHDEKLPLKLQVPLQPVAPHPPSLLEAGNPDLLVENLPRSLKTGFAKANKETKFFVKTTVLIGLPMLHPIGYAEIEPVNYEGLF